MFESIEGLIKMKMPESTFAIGDWVKTTAGNIGKIVRVRVAVRDISSEEVEEDYNIRFGETIDVGVNWDKIECKVKVEEIK